jgi:hypothetical protein
MLGQIGSQRPLRGENASIIKRRQTENAWRAADAHVSQERIAHQKHHWEIKSNKVIKSNALSNISRGQRLIAQQTLAEKRHKLATLLADEERAYR